MSSASDDRKPRPGPKRPPRPRKRAPGRPAGDGVDLRARVLDAANACAVRDGVAATSLRAIAAEANVTPALLHYYFGDKEQLMAALVEERLVPAFAILHQAVFEGGEDIAGLIAGFVRCMSDTIARHPWLPALWVREVLSEGGALRSVVFDRLAAQLPGGRAPRAAVDRTRGVLHEVRPAGRPRCR